MDYLLISKLTRKYSDLVEREKPQVNTAGDVLERELAPEARIQGNTTIVAEHEIFIGAQLDLDLFAG